MPGMAYGYLIGVLVQGALVLLTLRAPRRPRFVAALGFRVASVYNEAPFLFIYLMLISTVPPLVAGQFASPAGWAMFGLGVLVMVGLAVIAWRGRKARPMVMRALSRGLGEGWRRTLDEELANGLRTGPPIANILFMPFVLRRRDVERVANIDYGEGFGG